MRFDLEYGFNNESLPKFEEYEIKLINKKATGIADFCHDSSLGDNGKQSKIFFNVNQSFLS